MKAREQWIDRALREWAEWFVAYSRWQGFGGGVDKVGLLLDAGWGRYRTEGTYSNPTLAEIMATSRDGQDPHMRMHAEIADLPNIERRVVVARYCGRCIRVPRITTSEALARIEAGKPEGGDVELRWTGGPMPFAEVSAVVRMPLTTCYDALARARLRLQFRLEVARAIRHGLFAPDGGRLRELVA